MSVRCFLGPAATIFCRSGVCGLLRPRSLRPCAAARWAPICKLTRLGVSHVLRIDHGLIVRLVICFRKMTSTRQKDHLERTATNHRQTVSVFSQKNQDGPIQPSRPNNHIVMMNGWGSHRPTSLQSEVTCLILNNWIMIYIRPTIMLLQQKLNCAI